MKYLLLILSSFIFISSNAQVPRGQNMNQGQFYGKIIDAASNRPIEGASIQLVQNRMDTATKKKRDFTVAILLSDKKGEFLIDKLPVMGNYVLVISSVGYKTFSEKVKFDINMDAAKSGDMSSALSSVIKDLGNIKLQVDDKELESVVVTSTKPLLQMNLDRKVYNVEKDISAAGGTAQDVMKNIPSLNVDIDGNVTLRNASPQIFVDGRPTTLTLDQIPADQIASVEIITNPSAKYDASGGGSGILNIILKKARKTGYNGNLRFNIDSYGRPGGGGDINIRQGKVNFFSSVFVNLMKFESTAKTLRTDFLGNDSTSILNQNNAPTTKGGYGFARMGMDFFADNRNTFTLSGYYSKRKFETSDLLNINRNNYKNGLLSNSDISQRQNESENNGDGYGGSLSYKHNFAKAGKEITADVNYNYRNNNELSNFTSSYFDNGSLGFQTFERSLRGGNNKSLTLQSDYVNPLSKTKKIEAGVRYAYRSFTTENNNYIKNGSGDYTIIPALNSEYNFTDQVYAAYATFSHQINKFSYQAGLRAESSSYSGDYITKNSKFSNDYPFSLFPSLFLTYKLTAKQDIQMNYSRKVRRPNFWQLIPFIDYSDSLNLSVGNPDLIPEFTNLIEIGYSNQYSPGNSFFANLYGRNSNNLITKYQYRDKNPNPAKADSLLFSTYANANSSYSVGLELTGKNKINKWWEITSNVNLYNATIKAGNLPGSVDNSGFSWFAKLTNSFKLPKDFSVQVNADYQAKTLMPPGGGGGGWWGGGAQTTAQGYIKPNYGVDVSVRKNFLKNNAGSLTLTVSDILDSRSYSSYASSELFIQDNERIRKGQIFRLSFNWRFGKFDASLFKRKNIKGEMDNMQNIQSQGQ